MYTKDYFEIHERDYEEYLKVLEEMGEEADV